MAEPGFEPAFATAACFSPVRLQTHPQGEWVWQRGHCPSKHLTSPGPHSHIGMKQALERARATQCLVRVLIHVSVHLEGWGAGPQAEVLDTPDFRSPWEKP